jgi:hypothetical protein
MEITLAVLEQRLINLMNKFGPSWYALRDDAGLIRLVVNEASPAEIEEYLREGYAEYFEDDLV